MSLELQIVTGSTVPIYRQIGEQLCRRIREGALREGEQLPSVRALAEELVVNPNTVARAYGDLVREGFLEAQKGRGVFVARRRPVYTKAERLRRLDEPLDALISESLRVGCDPDELREALERKLDGLEGAKPTDPRD